MVGGRPVAARGTEKAAGRALGRLEHRRPGAVEAEEGTAGAEAGGPGDGE